MPLPMPMLTAMPMLVMVLVLVRTQTSNALSGYLTAVWRDQSTAVWFGYTETVPVERGVREATLRGLSSSEFLGAE